jgi:ectoine hydroxylase
MKSAEDRYPSRCEAVEQIAPRRDPVLYAAPDTPPPIDAALIRSYVENGFLLLDDVFTAEEVGYFQRESLALRENPAIARREETITEPDSSAVRSVFRVHQLSAVFAKLARDVRLVGLARYLLGDEVYLHQSRLNYKPGFRGREFYWHSDFETWHVEDGMPAMRALSLSIALTDNVASNGPLLLLPGSHRHYVACVGATPADHYQQSLRRQEYGVPSDDSLTWLAANGVAMAAGKAGSVLLFDCNTLHGSGSNITPLPRSNVFLVYNALSNRLQAPFCGRPPRPEFVAARGPCEALQAAALHGADYSG